MNPSGPLSHRPLISIKSLGSGTTDVGLAITGDGGTAGRADVAVSVEIAPAAVFAVGGVETVAEARGGVVAKGGLTILLSGPPAKLE